ncbi:MAG TPA: UTP--glucose-1-phosphate uridylyltransferase GalU [Polyangia bacterium]|nr:UTP--glucose-1-phosphate uridylyltransferase GalU [Polyangia bacterium]
MTSHAPAHRKVRKAVLPVAGLGTRILPATKAMPKEMLPLVDTPSIQLTVEECVAAGIEQIIFVTARGKSSVEDHFDRAPELEALLERRGKTKDLAEIRRIASLARFASVRQAEALGLGHAVLCAREVVGDEPFAVVLGDDLMDAKVPGIGQLIQQYDQRGTGVIGLKEVAPGQEHLYGIADGDRDGERGLQVRRLVEKPAPGTVSSRLAIIGRYVLPPEIFPILAETPPGRGGEIQLTDGLATLCARHGLYGLEVEGERFDVGDRAGYVVAMVHYALRRPELRDDVRAGIEKLLRQ